MISRENPKTAIEVRGLSWQAEDIKILEGIGLEVSKNSFVGIIGPNGSGKTSLLRYISAWYKPQAETVFLYGGDILSRRGKELSREIAVIAQNMAIEFDFTAMDVVLMGRFPHISRFGSEGQEDIEKTKNVMELTGTWDLKDRLVTNLSGGELQRVMIARALAQETSILLMDEPISNLDISYQVEIMDLIKGYQQEKGLTVITVLHDLNIAAQYCERLILLNKGEVYCQGKPEKVLTKENIKAVYGIDVHIIENPSQGYPYIMPVFSIHEGKNNIE